MTAIFLSIIIFTGYLFISLICRSLTIVERLALGFGAGFLLYSLSFFIQLLLGITMSKYSVLIITAILILPMLFFCYQQLIADFKNIIYKSRLMDKGNKIFLLALLFLGILILLSVFWPISKWDALTLYDFRGKLFANGLLFKDFQILDTFDKHNPGYYFAYPPATSLIHAAFYLLGGLSPQVIYPVFFLAMIILFYQSLVQLVSKPIAILFSLAFIFNRDFVTLSLLPYTNVPYIYFYFVSTIYLLKYVSMKKKSGGMLAISALFLSGASWIRFIEPFYIINLIVISYFVVKKHLRLKQLILYILPIFILRQLWGQTQHNFAQNSFLNNINVMMIIEKMFNLSLTSLIPAILAITGFVYSNIILFTILLLSLFLYWLGKDKNSEIQKWIFVILFLNLIFIIAGSVIVGIVLPGREEIYDSINRFGVYFIPFILFSSALGINGLIFSKKL